MDFDNQEIIKLRNQVRLLQLENNILRQTILDSNIQQKDNILRDIERISDNVTPHVTQTTSQSTSKSNGGKSNCGCKGNCSTKLCGCMKKKIKCNSLCKCDDIMCCNQKTKPNDKNKENIDKNNMKTPKKQMRKTRKNEMVNETKNIKDSSIPEGNKSFEATFDPMKPKHQLSRTPPNMKKGIFVTSIKKDDTIEFQSQSTTSVSQYESIEETKIVSPRTEGNAVKEEAIDWEQHTAQLIPCKRCKRTFMPDRIKKHESCCKNV